MQITWLIPNTPSQTVDGLSLLTCGCIWVWELFNPSWEVVCPTADNIVLFVVPHSRIQCLQIWCICGILDPCHCDWAICWNFGVWLAWRVNAVVNVVFVFETNYYLGFTGDRLWKGVSRRSRAIPVVLGYINTNIRSCFSFYAILGEIHMFFNNIVQ